MTTSGTTHEIYYGFLDSKGNVYRGLITEKDEILLKLESLNEGNPPKELLQEISKINMTPFFGEPWQSE